MVETVQQEYNCLIVAEVQQHQLLSFREYVEENNIQYLILAEKIH